MLQSITFPTHPHIGASSFLKTHLKLKSLLSIDIADETEDVTDATKPGSFEFPIKSPRALRREDFITFTDDLIVFLCLLSVTVRSTFHLRRK